jgi:hypothetical protein
MENIRISRLTIVLKKDTFVLYKKIEILSLNPVKW